MTLKMSILMVFVVVSFENLFTVKRERRVNREPPAGKRLAPRVIVRSPPPPNEDRGAGSVSPVILYLVGLISIRPQCGPFGKATGGAGVFIRGHMMSGFTLF